MPPTRAAFRAFVDRLHLRHFSADELLGTAFVFAGGVGVYDTFVHVDCRGVNQSWSGTT